MAMNRGPGLVLAAFAAACCLPVAAASTHEGAALNESDVESRLEARRLLLWSDSGTRAASAHLAYTSPLQYGSPVSWYNSFVPTHSSESTFFSTNVFGFGYAGLQQVEKRGIFFEGRALFSIWDEGCNHVMDADDCPESQRAEIIECGELAVCSRFGGEGTGAKSKIAFDEWQLEQTYGFMILAFQVGVNKVRYEGYFYAPELNGWVLISKIQFNTGGKSWYVHGMRSFVEQWDTKSIESTRYGKFGPGFVEAQGSPDSWTQITKASFSHTTGANEDATKVDCKLEDYGKRWGMGIAGDLVKSVSQYQAFSIYTMSPVPPDLQHFSTLRRNNQLPGGCPGGTCFWTKAKTVIEDAFSKTYIPITILSFITACLFAAPILQWWRERINAAQCAQPGLPYATMNAPPSAGLLR